MNFSIIAAADNKMGIGKNGKLPWQLSGDLKYFNKITAGGGKNAVIMGRTTWESLPKAHRPLKGRLNIILTNQKNYELPMGTEKASSLDGALKIAEQHKAVEIFVIGGANVYAQAIAKKECCRILLTEVMGDFGCDAHFPNFDVSKFGKCAASELHEENGIQFAFCEYKPIG